MRTRFEHELNNMHEQLIQMASLAESAIDQAVDALQNMDEVKAHKIMEHDDEIDQKEKDIERSCLRLLMQQQPVAKDLRNVSTALKMITDLERIGDQAADIAEIVIFLCKNPNFTMPDSMSEMAHATMKMVRDAINAFVGGDLDQAHLVIDYDNIVDKAFLNTRDQLVEKLKNGAIDGEQLVDLLMIAKYFERIGDHAVNIAEWVVFSLTGAHKDSRVM